MSPQAIYIIVGLSVSIITLLLFIIGFANIVKKNNEKNKKIISSQEDEIHKLLEANSLSLPYDSIIKIINDTIDTIWKDKYLLYYRLKEIRIIPNMDEEVKNITTEIIESFSKPFIDNTLKYFSLDYFTVMITRKVQMLLIEYTNTYKPNTK